MKPLSSSVTRRALLGLFALLAIGGLNPAYAADVGVVILHGKRGVPNNKFLSPLAKALEREGFLVNQPEMTWSKSRDYDKDYDGAIADMDAAVAELKKNGARKIFIAGHSFGANTAINYATRYKVDGILLLSPGHIPQEPEFNKHTSDSLARAKKMIAEGKGGETGNFVDVDLTKDATFPMNVSAKIYVSFMDPEGPANMIKSAAAIKPDTPLLVITASSEIPPLKRVGEKIFAAAPKHAANKHLVLDSTHLNVPADGASEIVAWLNPLKR